MIDNHQVISDTFNNYFLSVTDKITSKINDDNSMGINSKSPFGYLFQIHENPFPEMKTDPTSIKKFKKIIKSPKYKNSYGCDEIPNQLFIKLSICHSSLKFHTQ